MSDQDFNVTDPIFAWASRSPHAVALIEQGRVISYGMLCLAVKHAAQRFQNAGLQSGDIIGISLRGQVLEHLVVALALARMGMTQVTLPPGDPVGRRLSRAQTLGIKAVVTYEEGDRLGTIALITLENGWLSAVHAAPVSPDLRSSGGHRVWIVVQSSGTTGEPKNVEISHELYRIWSERLNPIFSFLPGERFMNMVGLRFWVGIWRVMCCLSSGGAVAALPEAYSATQLLQWIDMHHVTYMQCTPFHVHWLLQEARGDAPRLPGLRVLRCSSAALLPSLLQEVRRRLSPNVFISYGANETGTMTAATPDVLGRFPDSVGLPLPGVEFEIVDGEGHRVSAGTVGRVRVRIGGGKSAQRESKLMGDWIYPGDTASQNDEGIVFLKGRDDDVMNFDGILIGPTEIETVLARHPAIAEVAAFPLPSPQHQDVPAIAVVLKQPLPTDELNRYCAEHLGIRSPRVFIIVDEIPRNDMGKVLRRRLTEIALARLVKGPDSAQGKP